MKTKKEIDKDYYQSHKAEALKRVSNYYQKNKEKISAYKKKWWKNRTIKVPIIGEIDSKTEEIKFF